jgi:hypothetical protein
VVLLHRLLNRLPELTILAEHNLGGSSYLLDKVTDPCRSPRLRKALNLGSITMLQSTLHAIHFKHILNFGERQGKA